MVQALRWFKGSIALKRWFKKTKVMTIEEFKCRVVLTLLNNPNCTDNDNYFDKIHLRGYVEVANMLAEYMMQGFFKYD